MFSKSVAYVLGIISFLPPFNGLLRFYLKRPVQGVIYSLTAGCVWIGNILDIVQIPQLVRDANMRLKQRQLAALRKFPELTDDPDSVSAQAPADASRDALSEAHTIERHILRSAKQNGGITTPSEVALDGSVPIERAREVLDYLVSKGFAEIRVNRSGIIVYRFPDIIDPRNHEDFDDLS